MPFVIYEIIRGLHSQIEEAEGSFIIDEAFMTSSVKEFNIQH